LRRFRCVSQPLHLFVNRLDLVVEPIELRAVVLCIVVAQLFENLGHGELVDFGHRKTPLPSTPE
jgi:hypothetical protein